jgi:hypothetical protein
MNFLQILTAKINLSRAEFKNSHNSVNYIYIFKSYNLKNIIKSSYYKTASSLLYLLHINKRITIL